MWALWGRWVLVGCPFGYGFPRAGAEWLGFQAAGRRTAPCGPEPQRIHRKESPPIRASRLGPPPGEPRTGIRTVSNLESGLRCSATASSHRRVSNAGRPQGLADSSHAQWTRAHRAKPDRQLPGELVRSLGTIPPLARPTRVDVANPIFRDTGVVDAHHSMATAVSCSASAGS